jgi:hypothetical protein
VGSHTISDSKAVPESTQRRYRMRGDSVMDDLITPQSVAQESTLSKWGISKDCKRTTTKTLLATIHRSEETELKVL